MFHYSGIPYKHMNLKTATRLAIIGQIITLIHWQCDSTFGYYWNLEGDLQIWIKLLATVMGQGSLIYFLAVLYSKQK
jgi:hypothetical protein